MKNPIDMLRDRSAKTSQLAVSREIGISPAYLSDVMNGRRQPGPSILKFLGLEREIVYRRRK